ncbi:DUF5615 family PIN-like protein [Crocosphaera sp. UHCC 0190]|uniref:DUF5615 family PIN-like protein n=1 Tax=Crocosphaera sp. UHCC 0190 TaxID=3110246 RepID=UPI002B2048A3|nr:DUF5615 family PIN-like protein [Crocosphaera sp. UHCC 0190]MEA5509781.1 DUF5615 family PIN-like protein [Crocosphaera sp. UHCC 0190]
MTIALYMDEHIPKPITEELRRRGVDVLTVQEDNRKGISDVEVLNRAIEIKRVIFSQDQDFLVEANLCQTEGRNFTGVIYARQTRVSIGDCIRDLEIIAKASEAEDLANRVQYLPL